MNPRDSQITLVDQRRPPLVIELSRDNVKQTVMTRRGGNQILYKVESDASMTKTSVHRSGYDDPIAFIETKEFLGFDKITFKGEKRRRIRNWISGYGMLQTSPMSFEEGGERYHWRLNFIGQMALFNDYDSVNPIAWYERSKVRFIDGTLKGFRAFIAMEEEAMRIQDTVIVSFLVVENQARPARKP